MSHCPLPLWLLQFVPTWRGYKSPLVGNLAHWKSVYESYRDNNDGESPLSETGLYSCGKMDRLFPQTQTDWVSLLQVFLFWRSSSYTHFFPPYSEERKNATDSFSPDGGFYGSWGNKSPFCVSVCICSSICVSVYAWGVTCIVFICILSVADRQDAYLKIKLSLFRLQCKFTHRGSQSGSPESGSYVKFFCLKACCPWQQQQAHVLLELIRRRHMVFA